MKRTLSLLVCLTLLLASAAAGASSPADSIDWTEHATFTWWNRSSANDYYISYNENPVVTYLEEKFNVTFEFEEPVSGTEVDSLTLMLGTAQYTDVIDISAHGGPQELYADGVLMDIAPYLDAMPNLKAILDANEDFARDMYDDEGRILCLRNFMQEVPTPTFGLVYRRDILEEAAGGSVAFPSGEAQPTTIEDWEYMLPLYKQYFEDQGLVEYAALILGPQGFFPFGELTSSFGAFFNLYVEDGQVHYGPMEDAFFDYLVKMNEWYNKGWIYQDFASRTQDMFFMPNTQLTYGGAAGIWMGMPSSLGDRMGSPEEGIVFDVQPVVSPLVEGVGAENMIPVVTQTHLGDGTLGVSTACENPEKLLAIFDYMYGEEGGMLRYYGLTKEQIPQDDTVYAKAGLEDGAYWFDADGNFTFNPEMAPVGGPVLLSDLNGNRFPGYGPNQYEQAANDADTQAAYDTWSQYDAQSLKTVLPSTMAYTPEEEAARGGVQSAVIDYMSEMVPKFIMGTEALTPENWNAFKAELEAKGVLTMLEVDQQVYDRYIARD